jgi:hypothetical protein
MSQDTENFEQLRRLLALKRHEQPPPGYFNNFSRQVILRIQAGERGGEESFLERLFGEAPWLQRLWAMLEPRPVLVGACGLAVCGLMVTGLLTSEKADVSAMSMIPAAEPATSPAVFTSFRPSHPPFIAAPALPDEASAPRVMLTSVPMEGSLLGDISKLQPRAERATLVVPGN